MHVNIAKIRYSWKKDKRYCTVHPPTEGVIYKIYSFMKNYYKFENKHLNDTKFSNSPNFFLPNFRISLPQNQNWFLRIISIVHINFFHSQFSAKLSNSPSTITSFHMIDRVTASTSDGSDLAVYNLQTTNQIQQLVWYYEPTSESFLTKSRAITGVINTNSPLCFVVIGM